MARADRIKKGVTRVVENRRTTTGNQMNIRLTGHDDDALSLLVEAIEAELPNKAISRSRVLRAVGYLHEDKAFVKKLSHAICKNT